MLYVLTVMGYLTEADSSDKAELDTTSCKAHKPEMRVPESYSQYEA